MANTEPDPQTQILNLKKELDELKLKVNHPNYDTYQTSLTARYCSAEISQLFSQRSRHSTWRKLWLYLAESERELGIEAITPDTLEQMRAHLVLTDVDFDIAKVEEKKRRHDVMAHVHAFGKAAPAAAGIIHYGVSLGIPDLSLELFMKSFYTQCKTLGRFLCPYLLLSNGDTEFLLRDRRQAAMSPTTPN